jgi:hypothetical protein
MASSRVAQTRQYMQSLISTLIEADRVILGSDNFPANFNFYENLATDGFYVLIMPAKWTDWVPQDRNYKINVEVRIYYTIPADLNNDWTAIEDFCDSVFQVLTAIASYDTPGTTFTPPISNPNGITPPDLPYSSDGPHIDPNMKPLPAFTSFTFGYWGCTKS